MDDFVFICRIAEWRKLRGFTQTDLAALCGLSKNSISSYETGQYFPTYDHAVFIARALKISVIDLYLVRVTSRKASHKNQPIGGMKNDN